MVAAGRAECVRCGFPIMPGEPWDLGHVDGDRRHHAGPEHRRCNRAALANGRRRMRRPWEPVPPPPAPDPEPEGLAWSDPRWRVPWLKGLRKPPKDATWPRLMTVPHPRAVDSLGREFSRWAERRSGIPLRWWQRLVAARLLEVDAAGELVWETMLMTVARQCGKSWLLRELCLWRIHQGDRFGEPQDVIHTGKEIAICQEIQLPARVWARGQPELYKVREVNGQESIMYLVDDSRWMLRAKEAVYGYSASCGAVDEAWKVKPTSVDDGLTPTMAERVQPQLWLISTAHRLATQLMLLRRKLALAELATGAGDLLIEWSASREARLDDVKAWRAASPHWTAQRERIVAGAFERMQAGEPSEDEPDPEQSFRAQWLNQWPRKLTEPEDGDELLPDGLWGELAEAGVKTSGPIFVAVEDDYGFGAAIAAVAHTADGRLEIDGWLCPDWDSALADARRLGEHRRIRQLLVGASMLSRVPPGTVPTPQPAGSRETRPGLALLRDLAAGGQLVHDQGTDELDQALNAAQVKESTSGLQLVTARGPTHLVRAVVWAVAAAHRPARVPAIR
jgi:hypothetical protein